MRFLWVFWVLIGVWFLASAATENGLLPSGHGFGRLSEVLLGIGFIGYAIFRLRKGYGKPQ
jgi:hypothetical protein